MASTMLDDGCWACGVPLEEGKYDTFQDHILCYDCAIKTMKKHALSLDGPVVESKEASEFAEAAKKWGEFLSD